MGTVAKPLDSVAYRRYCSKPPSKPLEGGKMHSLKKLREVVCPVLKLREEK
jgi:hypothetical protein